jgi:hypothetical protein
MLLKLPPEILVQTLLDIVDLFPCELTSEYLGRLVSESVVLQYNVISEAANAQENPCLSLTIDEKLRPWKVHRG